MGETSLDLIEVNVRDWKGCVEWYRRTFDLEVAYEDEEHKWCELAFTGGGDARFALRGLDGVEHGSPPPFVISLKVGDLDAAVAQLEDRGVELQSRVKEATRPTRRRYRWVNLSDPEGNVLRVFEWGEA